MMAKPMKTLHLHYPMIQFLINIIINKVQVKVHLNSVENFCLISPLTGPKIRSNAPTPGQPMNFLDSASVEMGA